MSDWTRKHFGQAYLKAEGLALSIELTRHECRLAVQLLELRPSDQILDLACGHGRHSLELAKQGFKNIIGLDFSSAAIEQARADAVGTNINFVLGDMQALNYEQEFDVVLSFFNSMFYWDDQTHLSILEGIYRALKPGGRLFLDSYNPFFVVSSIVNKRALKQHRIFGRILAVRQQLNKLKSWMSHSIRNPGKPRAWHKTTVQFDPKTATVKGVTHMHTDTDYETHPLETRLYTFTEVKKLLEQAGFEVQNVVSNSGGTFIDNSPRFVVVALKK
jgi:ubiquinone/menaquinone biosynthesis C-methylase UbiE